jgi:Uma2 family endonuclease
MALTTTPEPETLADVLHRLGDIPPERILARPFPGAATEDDLIALLDGDHKRLCELIDGVLVEKAIGFKESFLAIFLALEIGRYLKEQDRGFLVGADAPFRLFAGRIRMPDVAFVSWDQLPGDELPDDPIADLAPRLAVEVLSAGNTRREMEQKLDDFFKAGVQLAWIIDPEQQVVDVYTSRKKRKRLALGDTLDGGRVLPGFELSLKRLFTAGKRQRKT